MSATITRQRPIRAALVAGGLVAVAGACSGAAPGATIRASAWTVEPSGFPPQTFVAGVTPRLDDRRPWVAVGWSTGADGQPAPACFRSADARHWEPCPLATTDLDGAHSRLLGAGWIGATFVAAGVSSSALHGNARPTLWRRDQVDPLAELDLPRELFGGPRGLGFAGMAAGPTGAFAVGGWTGATNQSVAQVWRTTDGLDWRRLDGVESLTSTPTELLRSTAVAVGGTRVVVVGGAFRVHPLGDGDDGAIWSSTDGDHWARASLAGTGLTGAGDQELKAVAPDGAGFVAGGSDGASAAVWSSADGTRWSTASVLPDARGGTVTALAAGSGRQWAAGIVGGAARLWSSTDGRRWGVEPLPAGVPASGVDAFTLAATDDLLLVVARTTTGSTAAVAPLAPRHR